MRALLSLLLCACAAHVQPLGSDQIARMKSSGALKDGCPVQADELRRVVFTYHGMSGADATGELVVHRELADEVLQIMRALYAQGFQLESARPIEDFGGSDDASMQANNTSAFNCRAKTPAMLPDGGSAPAEYSVQSFGRAIDFNPRTNPYFKPRDVAEWQASGATNLLAWCVEKPARCTVLPPNGRVDRSPGVGVLQDAAVLELKRRGWNWGGDWPSSPDDKVRTDLQHFEK
jgi:poly-gamma-glutamate synthesis protein (capsule biosynthesis protein)